MKTSIIASWALVLLGAWAGLGQAMAEPLKVCTTTTDLAALAREVGGDEVEVVSFAKGSEDAHFVEARPSFIRELSRADLYIQIGLDLEIGWAPVLLRGCRNANVQPGAEGYLDASAAIRPRDVPAQPVSRAEGDVHPLGNPHYLLDPVNGLKVARAIRDRLAALRPQRQEYFEQRYGAFQQRLAVSLIGENLAKQYELEMLMILNDHGRLDAFLKDQGHWDQLGGWLGLLRPYRGSAAVADHSMWNYFASRFGLQVIGYMEPRPGLAPTTRHMGDLVQTMRERNVKLVIAGPYFHQRHAEFLVQNTGARAATLAHQVEALAGTDDYISLFEHNIGTVEAALRRGGQ